jgi:hypothetical protein
MATEEVVTVEEDEEEEEDEAEAHELPIFRTATIPLQNGMR